MELHFICKSKDKHNQQILNIIGKTKYSSICDDDFWFMLFDNNNNIIASCSAIKENEYIYEINDMVVEKKYRGNNYSNLLLTHICKYFQNISQQINLKIISYLDNKASYYSYKKIFGDPYRTDNRFAYFSLYKS